MLANRRSFSPLPLFLPRRPILLPAVVPPAAAAAAAEIALRCPHEKPAPDDGRFEFDFGLGCGSELGESGVKGREWAIRGGGGH